LPLPATALARAVLQGPGKLVMSKSRAIDMNTNLPVLSLAGVRRTRSSGTVAFY
jgi:hypothetical protein